MKKKTLNRDINKTAFDIIKATTQECEPKNPAAVALGRLGGLKGGHARAKKLTAEQRRSIAKKAASTRWKKS